MGEYVGMMYLALKELKDCWRLVYVPILVCKLLYQCEPQWAPTSTLAVFVKQVGIRNELHFPIGLRILY